MAFSFGVNNNGSSADGGTPASAPAFGFGAGTSASGPAPAAPIFGSAPTNPTATGGPSFGARSSGSASTAFSFGTGAKNKDSSSSKGPGAFNFGSTTPAPATPGASKPPPTTTTGGFSFGGTPAPATGGADNPTTTTTGGVTLGGTPATAPTDSSKPPGVSFGGTPATALGSAPSTGETGSSAATGSTGGFSFGGSFAAPNKEATNGDSRPSVVPPFGISTPAPSSSKSDKKEGSVATPATGGFNFGGTTKPAEAPAPSGFSFGGNASEKDTKTTPATPSASTPSAPAPVETPKINFSASSTAVTTTQTTAAVAAAPTATSTPKEPTAIEYQTLTVEQILNKFQKQLEEDSLLFVEEAKRVCEYDAILRDSKRDIGKLATEAQRLMAEQEQTEQQIEGIGVFQEQIGKTLTQVEQQLDLIFQNQSLLAPQDADRERELAYDTAKAVDDRLEDVMTSLASTYSQLSMSSPHALGPQAAEIMQILNKHEDSLTELEALAQKLDLDCNEVSQMLQSTRY